MPQPAQGSASRGVQEVDMPRPAQGPNFREADMPHLARGLYLQEVVMPQPSWGSSP